MVEANGRGVTEASHGPLIEALRAVGLVDADEAIERRRNIVVSPLWAQDDGTEHWGRWVTQPWTDEQGGVAGIIISVEDITAQILAERDALRRQGILAGIGISRTAINAMK